MTFGHDQGPMGAVWKTGQEEANVLVQRSLDAGINFFDTADGYAGGQSEVMLGKALGERRKDVVLSTKIGFRTGTPLTQACSSMRHILNSAEECLKRLGTDYLDALSIDRFDAYTPFEESARALENLTSRGLVRYVGFSNFTAWQAAKFLGIQNARGYAPFIAAQMHYSLVGRDLEHEVVPFCQDAGIGIVVWSPLASGFLSGRSKRQDPTGRLSEFDILHIDKEKGYDLIDRMRQIASGTKQRSHKLRSRGCFRNRTSAPFFWVRASSANWKIISVALTFRSLKKKSRNSMPSPLLLLFTPTGSRPSPPMPWCAKRSRLQENEVIRGKDLYSSKRHQKSETERQGLQGVPGNARYLGAPAALSRVRPCRLL